MIELAVQGRGRAGAAARAAAQMSRRPSGQVRRREPRRGTERDGGGVVPACKAVSERGAYEKDQKQRTGNVGQSVGSESPVGSTPSSCKIAGLAGLVLAVRARWCWPVAPAICRVRRGTAAVVSGAGAANTVTVSGRRRSPALPTRPSIVLTVENDAATAPAAMDATSAQSNNCSPSSRAWASRTLPSRPQASRSIPIRTYDPTTGKETLTGYRAQNSVKVTLKDAATVAKVLAAGVETGVTLVSGSGLETARRQPGRQRCAQAGGRPRAGQG